MTVERRIAGKARELVQGIAMQGKPYEYRSLCESLPMMLRTAGLAQTVMFLRAKQKQGHKEDPYAQMYDHLQSQFRELSLLPQEELLVNRTTDAKLSLAKYRVLSEIAMAVSYWHKRMAQALLPTKKEVKAGGTGEMTGRLELPVERTPRGNRGLRLEKFMDQEDPAWGKVASQPADDGAYRMAYERWEKHWRARGGHCAAIEGRVKTRLATGLGGESVLEVGLRLNRTYGVPVIPGSGIKGAIRKRVGVGPLSEFLFGGESSAGFVQFQDAWWVPDQRFPLVLDVITVHHRDYYGGNAPPTDFDNPIPVPFLSVRGTFLFVMEFVGADAEGRPGSAGQWKEYVVKLVKDTLEKDGVGGKRASGYGRIQF